MRIARIAVVATLWLATSAPARADAVELDLTLYGGALVSPRALAEPSVDDNLDAVGLALGAAGFVRLGSLLGLGLVLEHDELGWGDDGSIAHDFALLAARLYFLEIGPADLHVQLGAGVGNVTVEPELQNCSIEEGFAAQLAVGAEWRLARALGLHTSIAAAPFGWGMGCDEIGYPGARPNPLYPGFGLAARVGLTSVWTSL